MLTRSRSILCALIWSLAAVLVIGCGDGGTMTSDASADAGAGDGPYTVVSTIGMVTDIVQNVAGERADVIGLMQAGIDPHMYQPTRSDVQRIMDADVVFMNGLMLEGKMDDALGRAQEAGTAVYRVTELIDESMLLESEELDEIFDPHVWMDPAGWSAVVSAVRDSLTEFDPEGASVYTANAAAYLERLSALDDYASGVLETVPERQRVLVTAHDAFNYFGARFGFEVVGIQGISTESEAGVSDIEALVELLVERNVGAVFVESTVSDRNVQALITGAAARGHEVVIGGELFSDAMGDAGTYEGTYIGMIDHNVTVIARALGGEAPKRGMSGELAE